MLRRLVEDLVLAFGFLTRLPMPAVDVDEGRKLSEALWAFPLAGLALGATAGAVLWICMLLGLGSTVAAIVALAALALLTGAMHEDGLADFWDGLGGGRTRERKLEIMRDSHIGTYGVLALLLSYLALAAVLVELSQISNFTLEQRGAASLSVAHIILVLAFAAMLSRAVIALPAVMLPIARDDGLAKMFGRPSSVSMLVSLLWPIGLALAVLQSSAIPLILGSVAGMAIISVLAWRYLGGVTGDVFGASIMMSFVGGLLATVAWHS